jgi:hypothetical protein
MPHIYSFMYSYSLTVMFNSIHTLGTMCDSSLGVWKNETLSNILLCYSWSCCWFWIMIRISLVCLTWWTRDHLTRELRSFVIFFGSMRYYLFNLILTSTLARSQWGMKFEICYVCYQYLGCSWVTCWKEIHSWSNTEWRPDVLLKRPDGCKLEQFEASRHRGRSRWKVLVVWTDDAWIVERLNGISCHPDGC